MKTAALIAFALDTSLSQAGSAYSISPAPDPAYLSIQEENSNWRSLIYVLLRFMRQQSVFARFDWMTGNLL